jgi:hypothetical protein
LDYDRFRLLLPGQPVPNSARRYGLERLAAEIDAILSANHALTAYNEERSGAQRRQAQERR